MSHAHDERGRYRRSSAERRTEFRAVKIYYDPDELSRLMWLIGWRVEIETTPWSFYYGSGGRG